MTLILITGSTGGIGLATAQSLVAQGHHVVVHGRSREKVDQAIAAVRADTAEGTVDGVVADIADFDAVRQLAAEVIERFPNLEVLINNAGVFKAPVAVAANGLDVRFAVNTIAPWLLTRLLLPSMPANGRVVNLSSAAQAPVDLDALAGGVVLNPMDAYAQSKLAITMWTRHLAAELGADGPMVVAVNPGSLLATPMVKQGFGVAGNDIGIGVDILIRASLSEEFADASGRYWDNDAGRFADPHPGGLDAGDAAALVARIESVIDRLS